MKYDNFSKECEQMIDPKAVGTISFMQEFLQKLPLKLQNKMIKDAAQKNPYISFIVEPYSTFLCYEIVDVKKAAAMLPDNFELIKTKIYEDDLVSKYYCIFSCFNVKTSSFCGSRMEFNVIARNKDTDLLTWVIVNYDTNSLKYDQQNGLGSKTTKKMVNATNCFEKVLVDIESNHSNQDLKFEYDLNNLTQKNLDQRLWFEGNLSIAYGKKISNNSSQTFGLIFDPQEVATAMDVNLNDLKMELNQWYPGLFDNKKPIIVCFKYAQHFLSDNIGHYTKFTNEQQMISLKEKIDFSSFENFNPNKVVKTIKRSSFITYGIIFVLLILYILK